MSSRASRAPEALMGRLLITEEVASKHSYYAKKAEDTLGTEQ